LSALFAEKILEKDERFDEFRKITPPFSNARFRRKILLLKAPVDPDSR
jgi:hypothetical protein